MKCVGSTASPREVDLNSRIKLKKYVLVGVVSFVAGFGLICAAKILFGFGP